MSKEPIPQGNETCNDDCIKCPECGYKETDDLYEYDEDVCEWECGDCGGKFQLSLYVSRSYTVSRDCGLEGKDHEWVDKPETEEGWIHSECKICEQSKASNPTKYPNSL